LGTKNPEAPLLAQLDRLALASLRLRGYRSRRVATSVGSVHVLDARGSGHLATVVLLHGFSSAAVHYAPLLERLRPHVRRLIVPDMPAHGFSDVPAMGMSAAAIEAALIEALDQVLDEPALIFGNSMGGVAAVRYASVRPGRARGIVLCSPGGAAMNHEELGRFVRSFLLTSHTEALGFVDRLLVEPGLMRPLYAWGVRRSFEKAPMRALLASLGPADLLSAEQLRALAAPVLLIWGKGDRVFPRSHFRFFRDNLPPHTEVREPAHVGHSPFLEDPDWLAAQIRAFGGNLVRRSRAEPAVAFE